MGSEEENYRHRLEGLLQSCYKKLDNIQTLLFIIGAFLAYIAFK